jgi:hypothetical protein
MKTLLLFSVLFLFSCNCDEIEIPKECNCNAVFEYVEIIDGVPKRLGVLSLNHPIDCNTKKPLTNYKEIPEAVFIKCHQ